MKRIVLPASSPAGRSGVHCSVRCLSCRHLATEFHPGFVERRRCALGRFDLPGTHTPRSFSDRLLLHPTDELVRLAAECTDFEPEATP